MKVKLGQRLVIEIRVDLVSPAILLPDQGDEFPLGLGGDIGRLGLGLGTWGRHVARAGDWSKGRR